MAREIPGSRIILLGLVLLYDPLMGDCGARTVRTCMYSAVAACWMQRVYLGPVTTSAAKVGWLPSAPDLGFLAGWNGGHADHGVETLGNILALPVDIEVTGMCGKLQ